MPERPKLTKPLLLEIAGGNAHLLECMHHGLAETSLKGFYPYLDLDETLIFAASSWKSRYKGEQSFRQAVRSGDVHEVFNDAFRIGFPWLNKYGRKITDKQRELYGAINPFNGQDFQDRLKMVDFGAFEQLLSQLKQPVNEYVFEGLAHNAVMNRGRTNEGLVVMGFHNAFPKKGERAQRVIAKNYAAEISRMFNGRIVRGGIVGGVKQEDKIVDSYPREHIVPLIYESPACVERKPLFQLVPKLPVQGNLF